MKMRPMSIVPAGLAVIAAAGLSSLPAQPALGEGLSADQAYSIVRGGKLYDKWFALAGSGRPKGTHKAWPASNTKKKGSTTHRCKSCHGWDYMGKDGAYKSGSYQTGIVGVRAYAGAEPAKIVAVLKNDTHGLGGKLEAADMNDLALFVSKGQVDMSKYIDYATKKPKGDIARGGAVYATVCSGCHGRDGKLPKEMKSFGKQMGNPWEVMHKILNGHPGEDMPSLRAFDTQAAADAMVYMATFPK